MNEPEFLYLTTTGRRTGLPREIEIWFVSHGGCLYLAAETGEAAQWVRNLRADPRVRWRLGDGDWSGRARVVDVGAEAALVAAVRARLVAKHAWSDGLIIELAPDIPSARRR